MKWERGKRTDKGVSPCGDDARLWLRECPYWSKMQGNRVHKCNITANKCTKKFPWLSRARQTKEGNTLYPISLHPERYVLIGSKHHGSPHPSGCTRRKAARIFSPYVHNNNINSLFCHLTCIPVYAGRAFAAITTAASSSSLDQIDLLWRSSS